MPDRQDLKRAAAERAVELIEPGMKLGLGTGSTARLVLEAIARRRGRGELKGIVGVPTSTGTKEQAERLGIPLTTLEDDPRLDLAIDGADEVDPQLELIKGLGGALLWEKIVASAADRLVIVIDESKQVDRLGTQSPLPVEVVPFGWSALLEPLRKLGAEPSLRRGEDGRAFRTDSHHYIIDCRFDGGIPDPPELERALRARPGVVETGLFLGMTDAVAVGTSEGARLIRRGA